MNISDKFDLIEDMATRIFTDLREIDSEGLDEESRECYDEAYCIAAILEDVVLGNIAWGDARRKLDNVLYGEGEE